MISCGCPSIPPKQQSEIYDLGNPSPVKPLIAVASRLVKTNNGWLHDAFLYFPYYRLCLGFRVVNPVYKSSLRQFNSENLMKYIFNPSIRKKMHDRKIHCKWLHDSIVYDGIASASACLCDSTVAETSVAYRLVLSDITPWTYTGKQNVFRHRQ